MLCDRDIMVMVLTGQTERFEELVRRHRSAMLKAAVSKLRDRSIAEEAVQDSFLAAFARRHTFRPDVPEYSVRGWLWTILLNNCRALARRELSRADRPSGELTFEAMHRIAGADNVLAELIRSEQAMLLGRCLAELPEAQADAIRMRFFGELKFQEIAQAMNCSENGAKLRVRSGLEKLATILKAAQVQEPLNNDRNRIDESGETGHSSTSERDHQ